MRHRIKKIVISYILSICFVFAFTAGCFKSENVYASYSRYVTASSLTIRKKATTSSAKVGSHKKGIVEIIDR